MGYNKNPNRKLAKELGLKTYVGKVHERCGTSLKYTSYGVCVQCTKIDRTTIYRRFNLTAYTAAKLREFGLTTESYLKMIKKQRGKCYICSETPDRICLDHNHKTGKLRKILCSKCNSALGFVKENPIILKKMISYLEEFNDIV